jgi:transposase-like protein
MELARFFCPNQLCEDYGKRGLGNIVLRSRYGKGGVRLLKCRACGRGFSERRFHFSFGLHTDPGKAMEVMRCLFMGMSFREAAEHSGMDKDTVNRIWKRFAAYCEESMDALVTEFNVNIEELIALLYNRGVIGRGGRKLEQR